MNDCTCLQALLPPGAHSPGCPLGELTEQDKATLDLESKRWKYAAQKDAAIRDLFDESPTAYYARLGRLLRKPAAGQFAPLTVHRLLRLEAARRQVRSSERLERGN